MADFVRKTARVGGRIVRYAIVVAGLLHFAATARAQQMPGPPEVSSPAVWDTVTAPAAAKATKVAADKPLSLPAKDAKAKTLAAKPAAPVTRAVTPALAPAVTPDAAGAAPAGRVLKRGHKGDPIVVQSELPPAASPMVTGAIGAAGVQSAQATQGAAGQPAQAPGADVPTKPAGPVPVTIGVYINDIQDMDFRTNSYIVDLYLWFRWRGKDLDPTKSVEFMNVFDPQNAQKSVLLDAPKEMPDGSLYNIVRYHGRFSKKFQLEKYPFDVQQLDFVLEDSVSPSSEMVFVPDSRPIGINPSVSLPGFRLGAAHLDITAYTYPTDFGDLSVPAAETYSRTVVSVPLTRPVFTLSIKTFGPILLIVICSTLVFFINPHFVEGRIGLAITALLTLVAIQFTAATSQPDADYFTMLDKLYMLSYAFIIAALLRVVKTSWQTVEGSLQDFSVFRYDRRWAMLQLLIYAGATFLIASWVMTK